MANNKITNRNIPLPIQREVRKRCGFGCVICGNPIYDYDHMKGWAEVKEHVAEDITLLCPEHHREATAKRLPREIIIQANEKPFNIEKGKSAPHKMYYSGKECTFIMGSDSYIYTLKGEFDQFIPLMIDGEPLINFIYEEGHLLLNVLLLDEFNHLVLQIQDNQLLYSVDVWDITFIGKTLTFREKHRKILFEIIFEPPNKVIINKGRILFNGVEIVITPDFAITNNGHLSIGNKFIQNKVGFRIGRNPHGFGAGRSINNVDRYNQ